MMARVPYLDRADLAARAQDLLARPIELIPRAGAQPERGARAAAWSATYIRHESKLDPRLREMAILQVGYLRALAVRIFAPRQDRPRFGVSDDDIRAIAEETAGRPTKLDR